MAVTQYIGSRYVPIFAAPAEWSSTKTYEPLTIVLHQGNSFTSKQFVPIGIDIDNTDFWAETGNYNAQIELYRQEVQDISNQLETKAFVFPTADRMQRSNLLFVGALAITSGFWHENDGGGGVYIITNKLEPNGYNELACLEHTAELVNFDSNYVPECYGAYADGTHDDSDYIQFIIDHYAGGNVAFNCKTYAIGKSLRMKRGMRLLGAATYDDDSATASTTIRLLPYSNTSMIVTPAAAGGSATHFLIIENILFDCNGSYQTEETTAIDFVGAYIGSAIKNTYIKNFYGTALNIQYADVEIDNLWIQEGVTLTNRYAMTTNLTIAGNNISCLANINHLYIENYANKRGGNPRLNVEDRADGLLLHNTANINISELHFEGCKNPIVIDAPWVVNIQSLHCAWCGYDASTAFIKIISPARALNIAALQVTSPSTFGYWLYKDGFTSNEIPDIAYNASKPAISYLNMMKSNLDMQSYAHDTIYNNNLGTQRIGGTDFARYKQYTDAESLDSYGYMKTGGVNTKFGSTKNQSTEKDFIEYQSYGTTADRVQVHTPMVLDDVRSSAANVLQNSLYLIDYAFGKSIAFQRTTGQNTGVEMLCTVLVVTSAPTASASYIGQMAVDRSAKHIYVATSVGSGASDWTQL